MTIFRGILIGYDFSPVSDLLKDEDTQVIRLKKKSLLGRLLGDRRLEEMERAIVDYFISRNEDDDHNTEDGLGEDGFLSKQENAFNPVCSLLEGARIDHCSLHTSVSNEQTVAASLARRMLLEEK